MQWYPWLNVTYNQILDSYRQNKGHHALLLNSKWDNGEDALIYAIIRWLNCSHPDDGKHCNICSNCKLMNTGNHPDCYILNPESNTQKIGVDVVRVCINSIYKYAYRSNVKIIFIKYIEHLTDAAINVLLKILDEPPINTYFFLKTREYIKTPLTLLSRCMRWSIVPPKESLGLQWLMEKQVVYDSLLGQCALRLCDGSPIEAESMFKLGLWEQRLELCKSMSTVIPNGNFLELVPFLKSCHNNIYYCLYWLIIILVDALKWKHGVNKNFITNLDQVELITVIAYNWNMLSLSNHLQKWLVLLRSLKEFTNINCELLLTYRLLNWKKDIIESCLY